MRYNVKHQVLMHHNFTKEDVILYLYNELEPEKRPGMEMAIATDPELLVFFQESLLLMDKLSQIQDEPDATVIRILGEESRSGSMEMQ